MRRGGGGGGRPSEISSSSHSLARIKLNVTPLSFTTRLMEPNDPKGNPTAATAGGLKKSSAAALTDGGATELRIAEFNLFAAHLR